MMTKTSIQSRLIVCFALLVSVSCAGAYPCHAGMAKLTAPSPVMKAHNCRGFAISLPSNWSVVTLPSGMSYCAAADGKKVTKDTDGGTMVSMYKGLVTGYRETASPTAKAAADEMVKYYRSDNPGLRVVLHEAVKMDGYPAESVLVESPTGRDGELERSLLLFAVKNRQLFHAAFTSPARDYGQMEAVFKRIAGSIRLTSWNKKSGSTH
jgi:hypothetical protein